MRRTRKMENKDVSKKLQDHESRILALEKILGNAKKPKIKNNRQTLPEHIIELRDEGFFSQAKIAEETHAKIHVKYPCELNRVEVALVRLAGKRQLRKASKIMNEREYQAYVW